LAFGNPKQQSNRAQGFPQNPHPKSQGTHPRQAKICTTARRDLQLLLLKSLAFVEEQQQETTTTDNNGIPPYRHYRHG